MKVWHWVLLAAAFAVVSLISAVIGGALSRQLVNSAYEVSYADFISILLTAISVLLTVLGLIIAALGVIGWNAISSGVRQRAIDFLEDGFKPGNPLHDLLKERVTEAMYEGVNTFDTNPQTAEVKEEKSNE